MKTLARIETKLDKILAELQALRKADEHMAVNLDALTQAVTDEETVDASVETLITGLQAQIAALSTPSTDSTTQASIDALVARLGTQKAALTAAVTANTPAAQVAQ
jgi:predicted  nucleic acid-binding Zn-ribbon protein